MSLVLLLPCRVAGGGACVTDPLAGAANDCPDLGDSRAVSLASPTPTNTLVLNEVVAWNDESAVDEDDDSPSWFEIYNTSERTANLEGWGVSDDRRQPYRWVFPSVTVAPRSYLRVFASGKDRTARLGWLHTNFQINPGGEDLVLTGPDGREADAAPATRLRRDVSWGRVPNGTGPWRFLAKPTPARSNSPQATYDSLVFDPPWFSHPGGFYPEAVLVTMASAEPGTVVRYTLDSSEPTEESPLAATPLPVASRAGQPNVLSLIPGTATANQHTDGWKPPVGEVRKATVVRARAFRPGALGGPVATQTYFIGPGAWRTNGVPTLSVVSPVEGLFDYGLGIYMLGAVFDQYVAAHPGEVLTGHTPANYTQRGPAWERAADLEYFGADGTRRWSEPVLLDIQGQSSRSFRQKSFGLKARGVAGKENTIDEELFPGLRRLGDGAPLSEFRHLRLRNAGNDWDVAMMRDDWCHRLVAGLGLDLMSSRPVSVFLDGEYWGVLTLREQQDPQYLREHYGLDPAEAVVLYGEGGVEEGRAGDELPFRLLRDYVSSHDLAVPAYYAYVRARIDLENLIRYQLAEIYFANADWPQNNSRVWRRRLAAPDPSEVRGLDGRWRWFLFDVDLGVGHPWSVGYAEDTLAVALSPSGRPGFNTPWATAFLRGLIRNPDFKREFLSTAADLLNSTFLPAHAVGLVETMQAELLPAMEEHVRRWRSCGGLVSSWRERVQVVRAFAQNRASRMRQHCVNALAPAGTTQLWLDVAARATGRIRVNSLLIDTNLPGAATEPYPWRGTYFREAPVTLEAIPAPGYRFAGWTGLTTTDRVATVTLTNALQVTARFVELTQDWTALALTELHYHPPATDGTSDDPVEFLELRNTGLVPLDLSGAGFTGGIAFAFAADSILAPGAYLVLAEDQSAFAARFPGVAVHGEYGGRLDNGGETLTLGYPGGPELLSVTYDDRWPWPTLADGGGASLQQANSLTDASDPRHWCAAPPTPGAETPPACRDRDADGLPDSWELAHQLDPDDPGDAGEDTDLDGLMNGQEYRAGTDPRDPSSVLRVDQVRLGQDTGTIVLSFTVRSNVACQVQACCALGSVDWTETAFVPRSPSDQTIHVTNRLERSACFYRLTVPMGQ